MNATKEDGQMVCPLSYDDPSDSWPRVLEELSPHLPLRDVICKSPTSGIPITVAQLPIRFMPSSANLFKDTDHPFRWFLAPYVELYVLNSESLEAYKAAKPHLKAWVDARNANATKRQTWLIIYSPLVGQGGQPTVLDTFNKVFARISSDWYAEKSGDRSVFLLPSSSSRSQSIESPAQHNASLLDLTSKMRKCIVTSFQQRTALYDTDVRRLDSLRGTPQLDFRQLFLVKESLALMYQMMQLPSDAFVQYEELEALLAFSPPGQLPENEWPMAAMESTRSSSSKQQADTAAAAESEQSSASKETAADPSSVPYRHGTDVLVYSINTSRMKILKNKMSVPELHRYLFARQMYFLTVLKNTTNFAEKGLSYLNSAFASIKDRVAKARKLVDDDSTKTSAALRRSQAHLWATCAGMKIFIACQEQLTLTLHPSSIQDSLIGREATQYLCEILRFTSTALHKLTCAVAESRKTSFRAALDFTSWQQKQSVSETDLIAQSDHRVKIDSVYRTDDPHAAFSLALQELAPRLVLGSSPALAAATASSSSSNSSTGSSTSRSGDAVTTSPANDDEVVLLIHFLRLVMVTEASAGRNRYSTFVKLQLSDLLFSVAAYREALQLLLEVRSCSFPSADTETSKDSACSDIFKQWDEVRYCVLRKILLVARIVEDRQVYCFTALQILEPGLLAHYVTSPAFGLALMEDVELLCRNVERCAGKSSSLLPLKHYLRTSVRFNASAVALERVTKTIHDESVVVSVARLPGGVSHRVALTVHSLFQQSVTVESVSVTYCALSILQARAVANSQSMEFDSENMFECFPCQDENSSEGDFNDSAEDLHDSKPIVLHPGEQTLMLKFRTPCTGEYGLMSMQLHIGRVTLQDALDYSSLGSLLTLCQEHTLVSVEQPLNLLGLSLEASTFSPVGQQDDVYASFSTQAGDQVTGLRVWAIPGHVAFEQSQLCRVKRRAMNIDRVEPIHEFPVWSKKLQAPLAPPTNAQHAPIALEKAAQWSVSTAKAGVSGSSSTNFTATPKKESSGLEHLSFSPLRGMVNIRLKIPFTAEVAAGQGNLEEGGDERFKKQPKRGTKVVLSVILQGVLLRRGCAIAFDTRAECLVTISDGLVVQCTPMGLFADEFFLQCVLANASPVPLAIASYSITCYGDGGVGGGKGGASQSSTNLWSVVEGPEELADEAAKGKAGKSPLHLHPRNEFHAAYQIRASATSSKHSRNGLLSFVYRRASDFASSGDDTWTNERLFKITCPIQNPADICPTPAHFQLTSVVDAGPVKCGSLVTLSHTLVVEEGGISSLGAAPASASGLQILVRPCETDEWLPVGHSRQVLVSATHYDRNGSNKSTFEFSTEYVPLIVGDLPLPPLLVGLLPYHPRTFLDGDSVHVFPTAAQAVGVHC